MEATTDDKGKLRETGGRKAIGTKPGSEGWSIKYPLETLPRYVGRAAGVGVARDQRLSTKCNWREYQPKRGGL